MNMPMLEKTGNEFEVILQIKFLSLCWSFKLQRQSQSEDQSNGEGFGG
jgi:hypothetical protein